MALPRSMKTTTTGPAVLSLLLVLAPALGAQEPLDAGRVEIGFPLVAQEAWGEGLRFENDAPALRTLERQETVVMTGVLVPSEAGIQALDLDLRRIRPVHADVEFRIDGQLAGSAGDLQGGLSAWTGKVVGEPDSNVFLAFSRTGTRGWVHRDGGIAHVFATADGVDGWERASSYILHASDPLMADVNSEWTCGTDTSAFAIDAPAGTPDEADASGHSYGTDRNVALVPVALECKVAVETDWQFYQNFNNTQAATDYVTSLFASVSAVYKNQLNTVLTISQLNIYSNPSDPWSTQEQGGGSGGLLDEFTSAWRGQNYPAANLAHFVSGASLGGGVATLGTVCNNFSGFGVSGNIHGQTPLPVTGAHFLNWDFMVVSHEIGHNFGTPHTHDYCPPIDTCYPGSCSSGGGCTNQGTIMSYCHLCSGGMTNIQPQFSPLVAHVIAGNAEDAFPCLGPFDCTACGCPCADIQQITPTGVDAFPTNGPELLTLTGSGFNSTVKVFVDGRNIPSTAYTIVNDSLMEIDMPLVDRVGAVEIGIGNFEGVGVADVQVNPVSPPLFYVEFPPQNGTNYIIQGDPIEMTVAAEPGDLVIACASTDLIPTVLPGFFAYDIGRFGQSLYRFWTFFEPGSSYKGRNLSTNTLPTFVSYYFQAGILRATNPVFPLVMSNWVRVDLIL